MAFSKHTTMSSRSQGNAVSRRTMFAALPAALAVGAVPALAAPSETPVAILFAEWKVQHAKLDAPGLSEDDCIAIHEGRDEIEMRLFSEPSLDCRDVCLKMIALTFNGEDWSSDATGSDRIVMSEAKALAA